MHRRFVSASASSRQRIPHLWWLCGRNPQNLSTALPAIAFALDGKLHGNTYDDLLVKAY
jgi:hypothetical protein